MTSTAKNPPRLALGILCGIGAGMLFGTDFLPAQILKDFSSLEFYAGRAFFFGLASLFFCRPAFKAFMAFTAREKAYVACLNAAGFWLYSLILFWSLQNGNPVIATMIVGMMPATIALFSKKPAELGALFLIGLLLILAGLGVLHMDSLGEMKQTWLAWVMPFGSLALWTWYGVKNAAFVQRHPQLSKTDMVSIMGVMTFVVIGSLSLALVDLPRILHHEQFGAYILWSAVLGVGSSWLGFWLWNICSRHCPPSIAGPLLVSETMFGLLYTFLWQQRLPKTTETAAIALFATGALLVVYAESRETRLRTH